jgi:uncharacterized membrane protein
MKKSFFTGFITLLPLVLTLMIISWVFDFLTTPFIGLTEKIVLIYQQKTGFEAASHQSLILFTSRVLALIFLIVLIFILGFLGRKFFFNTLLCLTNKLFMHIPLVKTIYRLSKEVTKAVFAEGNKTFKQTVLIAFPVSKMHTVAFITGGVPENFKKALNELDLTVFVPTAPHPFSGYLVLTSKKEVIEVDIGIEEAFKFIVSCGVIHPGQTPPQ